MNLTYISRKLFSENEKITDIKNNNSEYITINVFENAIKALSVKFSTLRLHCERHDFEFKGNQIESLHLGVYKNDVEIFKYSCSTGIILIRFTGKITDELIVFSSVLAQEVSAYLLADMYFQYPMSKVIAAQKRLSKKSKEPEIEYQKESFGGNNMWLAIRSSLEEVKAFYNLDGEEKPWADALENMLACEGMFMYEFKGWTFIAGQKAEILFDCQVKGEEAIEKCHVDKLLEWGKTFNDVQLFMHYNRSMYFNAFYRVLHGEMVYGEYETESYQKKYGKMPKNVKDLPDSNANTVALEWSYDPDHLRYQKELENAKAWVVNVEEDA